MVKITIDNKNIEVDEGTTIIEAAKLAGIEIPHLCYLKSINQIASCKVCSVEVEGINNLVTACNTPVSENMVIHTNSPKAILNRKKAVELILSEHDARCPMCIRSGNCSLQKLSNDLNVRQLPFTEYIIKQDWDENFPLIRNSAKCIRCMRCVQICDKVQDLNIWELSGTGLRANIDVSGYNSINESSCSLCGQCITHCPVGALVERDDTDLLWEAIADTNKTVVVQVAPAVRAAWGEEMGLSREEATVNKIFDGLKQIGVDYVFDTTFSADLTIMEEATEFLERYTKGELKDGPMFTSCCPGWVRFIKGQYPHLVSQLSTAKSPMQMFGSVMKSYFAETLNKDPQEIFSVAVMPCLAKKSERERDLYYNEFAGHDTDCVITTRELIRMFKTANINPKTLIDADPDDLFKDGSGAGVIFGSTGGVMEAALRTAYHSLTGENPSADAFKVVRRDSEKTGLVEANFKINDIDLHIAVVNGLANTRKLINDLENNKKHFDFVEVMACPGGCVGGGGQPIHDGEELAFTRSKNLYFLDKNANPRFSHENQDIINLYDNFFGEPNSHLAHQLLHTDHYSWQMPNVSHNEELYYSTID